MNKILLIRHAQSIGNQLGFIQGKTNYELSQSGEKELKKLIDDNKDFLKKYDSLVSSPLIRARQTANIIGMELNKEVSTDVLLEEYYAGILEGLKKTEAKEKYPNYYEVWKERGDLDEIPGAEKGDVLQARVLMFLEKFLNNEMKEIVVSHAGFIRSLINTVNFRKRTTQIPLNHDNMYTLNNVWENIGVEECINAKNSKVFIVDTYDKKYIMKKSNIIPIEEATKEKELLEYLSTAINIPKIIGLANKKDYILKVMDYAKGDNNYNMPSKVLMQNTTKKLYELKELLRAYGDSSKYNERNIIKELNYILNTIDDSEIKNIIVDILKNEKFNRALIEDEIQIVHDDLHRDNIIYKDNEPVFLDFECLEKWPSTYQLASHIAANYLINYNDFNVETILNNWPEKIELEYLKDLIIVRLLYGYNYFYKRTKNQRCSIDDYDLQKKYKKAIKQTKSWKG